MQCINQYIGLLIFCMQSKSAKILSKFKLGARLIKAIADVCVFLFSVFPLI